ncbi:MAG: hypothetical protein VKQ33_16000 [Candidatus Sericytochromatia bacterium]|nr:hypothetical protein [Candidatus Sericytochromatia bacterium]
MARLGRLALGFSLCTVVGCVAPGTPPARQVGARPPAVAAGNTRPAALPPAPNGLQPPTVAPARRLRALGAVRDLVGTASLSLLADAYFRDSASAYRLLGEPVGRAMVTVSALDEALYARAGQAVTATTNASGTYRLPGGVPADEACVVNVTFAGGHRLCAIAPAGAQVRDLDEATTLVAELARWQLRPDASASGPSVQALSSATLNTLEGLTRDLLASVPLAVTPGPVPAVEALQLGAGHRLRNAYVEAFGGRITAGGTSLVDQLADAWRDLLGFQPLALTRVAGVGIRGYSQSDGEAAEEAQLVAPMDAQLDSYGHLYLSQYDVQLVTFVPGEALSGPIYGEDQGALEAGKLYTIGGVVNGPKDPNVWEDIFRAVASDTLGDGVPMYDPDPAAPQGFPLYSPHKLALEEVPAVQRSHVYVSQPFCGRVLLMPAASVRHFRRNDGGLDPYLPRHLYAVAGRGVPLSQAEAEAWTPAADGELATEAGLFRPTGLTRDAAGNLWLLDAGNGAPGTGGLLVVAEADGRIYRIPLTREGQPFTPDGALDLALSPGGGHLYVADTERHWVFRLPTPTVGAQASPVAIERVAGRPPVNPEPGVFVGTPGFVDTGVRAYPSVYDVSAAEPDFLGEAPSPGAVTALLNRPGSLCFDAAGDLLIGDTGNGRIRLKRGADLYTVAGGLDTRYLTGDARLAYLPALGYLSRDPAGNVLLTDRREAVVRRLHTARGTLLPPP